MRDHKEIVEAIGAGNDFPVIRWFDNATEEQKVMMMVHNDCEIFKALVQLDEIDSEFVRTNMWRSLMPYLFRIGEQKLKIFSLIMLSNQGQLIHSFIRHHQIDEICECFEYLTQSVIEGNSHFICKDVTMEDIHAMVKKCMKENPMTIEKLFFDVPSKHTKTILEFNEFSLLTYGLKSSSAQFFIRQIEELKIAYPS